MQKGFEENTGGKTRAPALRRRALGLGAMIVTAAAAGGVSCSGYDQQDAEETATVRQDLGAPVTVSFQNGVLPTSSYAGNTDSSIKQATATTNYGTATSLEADGDDGERRGQVRPASLDPERHSLGKYRSVGQHHAPGHQRDGQHVQRARLCAVRGTSRRSPGRTPRRGSPWATAGALGAADRGAVVGTVTGAVGTRTINLNSAGIALVQSWVNGGANAGVVIAHATNTNGIDFASSEHATLAQRPRLNVTYLPPNSLQTALDFDGVNDYVTMGAAPSLRPRATDLEAWMKRMGAGQSTGSGSGGVTMIPLIAKGRGESDGTNVDCNYFFGIRASDGVLAADFEDMATGANHPVVGTTPVSSNVWHHVAASYDGTTWRLYLDGALDATLAANATPRSDSIQHFGIGTAMNSTGVAAGFFDGVIDEVRVWNHARSLEPDPEPA